MELYDAEGKLIKLETETPAKLGDDDLILSGAMSLADMVGNYAMHVFCTDCSGSMSGHLTGSNISKLEMMKRACENYIEKYYRKHLDEMGGHRATSRMALVPFETVAHVAIGLTEAADLLTYEVRQLKAGGGTDMAGAMELALNLLKKDASDEWIPHIVLISDGQPNSQDAVKDVIRAHQNQRVTIDCMYIGTDDDYEQRYLDFMRELSRITDGIFVMIDSEAEFERKFLQIAERKLLGAPRLVLPSVG